MSGSENRFSFRLDKDFHKDLKRKALEEDVSLAEVIRGLLHLWLEGEIPTLKPEPLRSDEQEND